jgi:hypothetical protein
MMFPLMGFSSLLEVQRIHWQTYGTIGLRIKYFLETPLCSGHYFWRDVFWLAAPVACRTCLIYSIELVEEGTGIMSWIFVLIRKRCRGCNMSYGKLIAVPGSKPPELNIASIFYVAWINCSEEEWFIGVHTLWSNFNPNWGSGFRKFCALTRFTSSRSVCSRSLKVHWKWNSL